MRLTDHRQEEIPTVTEMIHLIISHADTIGCSKPYTFRGSNPMACPQEQWSLSKTKAKIRESYES